jgi:hypothetical protein
MYGGSQPGLQRLSEDIDPFRQLNPVDPELNVGMVAAVLPPAAGEKATRRATSESASLALIPILSRARNLPSGGNRVEPR